MSAPSLVDFKGDIAPEYDRPKPERLLRGNPLRTTWVHHRNGDTEYGLWACEPGAWRIEFHAGREEFFRIIEGRIRITSEAGDAREFGPGDACVIPPGFRGSFEVLEPVRKHFIMKDSPQG